MSLGVKSLGNRFISTVLLGVLLSSVLIYGCKPPPVYDMAQINVAKMQAEINQKKAEEVPPPAPVVTMSGPYVDTKKISLVKTPAWLKQSVVLHGNKLPFIFYLDQILDKTGAKVTHDERIDKKKLISMEYSGSVRGALDELSVLSGYYYSLDKKKGTIDWSALMTKTFSIQFMPGGSNFEVGQPLTSSSGGGSSGSSGSSSSSSGSDSSSNTVEDQQYSRFSGKISVWDDLEATVNSLLSEDGKVTVSQAMTTITVTDRPENIKIVENYINKMNKELSKQVRIQVKILQILLNDDFSYGIDWSIVKNYVHSTALGLASSNFTNANLSQLSPTMLSFKVDGNGWKGTDTVIQALQQQGKLSVLTEPTVITLNNQVGQFSLQRLVNYISETTAVLADTGGSSSSGVTTDTVSTGLSMYLLPKIKGNDVYLQISILLSDLLSLDSFNTSSGEITSNDSNPKTPDSSSSNPQFVQLPKIDARIINQRAVIPTGTTLILAGLKQGQDETKNSSLYEFDRLGAQSATRQNAEIIFLITPVILTNDDEIEEEG